MKKEYEFDAVIHEAPENGGAYVVFPWGIRKVFGKGRVRVHASFDGILKAIRKKLNKGDDDSVHVIIRERE